jgi:hypothetical protein
LLKEGYAIIGGQAITSLTSRNIVFPSYGYDEDELPDPKGRFGTVLVYNFYADAVRMAGLTDKEKVERVLDDI